MQEKRLELRQNKHIHIADALCVLLFVLGRGFCLVMTVVFIAASLITDSNWFLLLGAVAALLHSLLSVRGIL